MLGRSGVFEGAVCFGKGEADPGGSVSDYLKDEVCAAGTATVKDERWRGALWSSWASSGADGQGGWRYGALVEADAAGGGRGQFVQGWLPGGEPTGSGVLCGRRSKSRGSSGAVSFVWYHRRVVSPESYTLAIDLAGPFKPGRDQEGVGRYIVVAWLEGPGRGDVPGAVKEMKRWKKRDYDAKRLRGTGAGGPKFVKWRLSVDLDTHEILESKSMIGEDQKAMQTEIDKQRNLFTVLYYQNRKDIWRYRGGRRTWS